MGFIRAVSLDPADVLKLQPNSRENQPKSRYSQTHARESYAVPHSSQSAPLLPNGWPDACSHHPSTRATEAETGTDNTHFDHGFYEAQGHRSRCDSQLAFGAHRSDECPDHEQWQEKQYENVHHQQRKRARDAQKDNSREKRTRENIYRSSISFEIICPNRGVVNSATTLATTLVKAK